LINTPASDMGPDALEQATRYLASQFDADVSTITGDALLEANFPLIHTVGRAAARAPRLIELTWGQGPEIALVGKGVCFDTGGLNLKPGNSMALMKKDMGGAACILGLAHMVMSAKLGVRLRVLIPAVENAVSGSSMRPGDILTSRKGLSVEVNNTDAEGRLVLADALAFACEGSPELVLDMATLTGAARVALGPDLPPLYTDDDELAADLSDGAEVMADPIWRMPLWPAYETDIEPEIADLDNAPTGGFAGSITAALFLKRFVNTPAWAHFDIYGWAPKTRPGRPKGGECQASRAAFHMLKKRYG
ncbi:MAG: leucyl aminopeptidase family protein, partial [Pseudomonadota bacterium]